MFLNILIYSIIAGISTVAGTLLIFYKYKWARHNSVHLMSFAAGIILALAFLHLIPESIELANPMNGNEPEHNHVNMLTFILTLTGFVAFYAIESIISMHPQHDVDAKDQSDHGKLSILAITGLTFHSMLDGIILTVGFKAGFQIGLMTTMAILLHKMPDGIITTSILLHDNMQKKRVLRFSLMVASATPFSAIVSYFLFENISNTFISAMLAIAAGSMIYISGSDLIPETHKEEKWINTIFLIIGMAVLYFMGRLLGHGH